MEIFLSSKLTLEQKILEYLCYETKNETNKGKKHQEKNEQQIESQPKKAISPLSEDNHLTSHIMLHI